MCTTPNNQQKSRKHYGWIFLASLLLVLIIWAAYASFLFWGDKIETRIIPDSLIRLHNYIGAFGDYFGALNTLFAGLAFAGLIVTIRQQSDDLQDSQIEMRKQTDALHDQTITNVQLLEKERMSNLLFKYLDCMRQEEARIHTAINQQNTWEIGGAIFELRNYIRVEKLNGTLKSCIKDLTSKVNEIRWSLYVYALWRNTLVAWFKLVDDTELSPSEKERCKCALTDLLSPQERATLYLQTEAVLMFKDTHLIFIEKHLHDDINILNVLGNKHGILSLVMDLFTTEGEDPNFNRLSEEQVSSLVEKHLSQEATGQ